ncbi:hypothetical protein DFJ73DRAFT_758176 [Zopfochytrium polystomum]|nr:hypothetical protein DFJ73DRAFT_758176 [Zopfochytrium polystomum]
MSATSPKGPSTGSPFGNSAGAAGRSLSNKDIMDFDPMFSSPAPTSASVPPLASNTPLFNSAFSSPQPSAPTSFASSPNPAAAAAAFGAAASIPAARSGSMGGGSVSSETYGLPLTPEEAWAYGYFLKLADPQGTGAVNANAAVEFLSKSKLENTQLSQIWNLADSDRRGYLDGAAFFKALKFIALVQAGQPLNPQFIGVRSALPHFEGVTVPPAPTPPAAAARIQTQRTGSQTPWLTPQLTGSVRPITMQPTGSGTFTVSNEERDRYFAAWNTCKPTGGFVTGDAARELFLKSGLAMETLSRVWLLVDTKGAMKLNLNQFMVAMYVISKLKSGSLQGVPAAIPPSLWNAISAATSTLPATGDTPQPVTTPSLPSTAPVIPRAIPPPPSSVSPKVDRRRSVMQRTPSSNSAFGAAFVPTSPSAEWVVKPNDKAMSDRHFDTLDVQKKGFLTGGDCYEFFLKSKLDQNTLAQIWDLACYAKTGNLSRDEFAVSMHLIKMAMSGQPLPEALPQNFMPPSFRDRKSSSGSIVLTPATSSAGNDLMDVFNDAFASPSSVAEMKPALAVPPLPRESGGISRRMTTMGMPPSAFLAQTMSPSSSAPGVNSTNLLNDDRSADLARAKEALSVVEKQMAAFAPGQEELRARKLANEAELKEVTRKKQELTLQLTQASATFEAESAILTENQAILEREQELLAVGQQELAQAQKIVQARKAEKEQLLAAIEAARSELAECNKALEETQTLSRQYQEETDRMRPRFTELHTELKKQSNLLEINKQVLTTAQVEYEQLKSDLTRDETRLAAEKQRLSQLTTQISVQTAINEKEKAKAAAAQALLNETAARVAVSTESLNSLHEAAEAISAMSSPVASTSELAIGSTLSAAGPTPRARPPAPPPPASRVPASSNAETVKRRISANAIPAIAQAASSPDLSAPPPPPLPPLATKPSKNLDSQVSLSGREKSPSTTAAPALAAPSSSSPPSNQAPIDSTAALEAVLSLDEHPAEAMSPAAFNALFTPSKSPPHPVLNELNSDAMSFNSGRRSSTRGVNRTLANVDIDAEFDSAFADADVAAATATNTAAAAVAAIPADALAFTDDAFKFDASFGPAPAASPAAAATATATPRAAAGANGFALPPPPPPASRKTAKAAKTVDFAAAFDDFDSAFGPPAAPAAPAVTSAAAAAFDDAFAAFDAPPNGSSAAASTPAAATAASTPAVTASVADLDAAFGGSIAPAPAASAAAPASASAFGFADSVDFDSAFTAFDPAPQQQPKTADAAVASEAPAATTTPAAAAAGSPKAAPAEDEGVMDEVKELMNMGFSKADSVKALEKHGFDLRAATNELLGDK